MKALLVGLILLLPLTVQAEQLTIFAASSLSEALSDVAASYEAANPGVKLRLHFAGSQVLAAQIEQGAAADLFISANPQTMARLLQDGLVGPPLIVASNRLTLAVIPERAKEIRTPADLADTDLLLVIGNPQVPVGRYTRELLDKLAADPAFGAARVKALRARVVSEENQVKAIVAKLLLGEADAGIVYQSDLVAPAARKLAGVSLPSDAMPQIHYPAAIVLEGATQTAKQFLHFLASSQGAEILLRHGFLPAGASS
jgi:molybdate transport system substrate-binding protein